MTALTWNSPITKPTKNAWYEVLYFFASQEHASKLYFADGMWWASPEFFVKNKPLKIQYRAWRIAGGEK